MTKPCPTLRRRFSVAFAALLALAAPGAASALTPFQIEAGARSAPVGVRETTTQLASDAFQGRNNQTEGSEIAQAYLIGLLREIGTGVNGGTADADYKHAFAQGTNLLAVIRGRELPDEYVMIGGHYDHLGVSASGDVYNGAADNASGTAAAIAVARAIRALPEAPRRSIVVALWDAEEDGLLGSIAYVDAPAIPIERTVAYVNLDIQGSNLSPTLSRTSIAVGAETGGTILRDVIDDAVRAELKSFPSGVETLQLSYIFGQLRSDYASFVAAEVPTVFFSDSTASCYHTVDDETRFVDFDKLASQTRIAFRTTVNLAEATATPGFIAPNPALATYADAITLDRIFDRARPDLNRFLSDDRKRIEKVFADVGAIADRGADEFQGEDVPVLLGAAVDTLAAIDSSLKCGGYFGRKSPFELRGNHDHGGRRTVVTPPRLPRR